MKRRILYCGDTALNQQASYLAGVLTYCNIDFDYLDSTQAFDPALLTQDTAAVVLSDYPSANFTAQQMSSVAQRVSQGTGLCMIGGWESFSGAAKQYTHTPIKDVLPVIMYDGDDRVNCSEPCLIEKYTEHPIFSALPFEESVPHIGGYNRFKAKADAQTLLLCRRFIAAKKSDYVFSPVDKADPLLVVGSYGKGRVTALATDAAPHWVGGFVDWGSSRVTAQAKGAEVIEVGSCYAEFFANLINWVMNS